MPILPARSNAEAHLYMELNPCGVCGALEIAPGSSITEVDGQLVTRFAGPCPGCGTVREFAFQLPADEPFPDEEEPAFGDDRPSTLVDPGQWLWVADLIAESIPADDSTLGPEERWQARFDLRIAAAAVAEAAKFLPRDADAVPVEALWTDRGQAVYREEPARFRRLRLAASHRAFRELADRLGPSAAAQPPDAAGPR